MQKLFWLLMCMLMATCGEAANPGPWHLTASNPTGVATKAELFEPYLPGIAAISETHLTQMGAQRFQSELRTKCPGAKFHYGTPVEHRSGSVHSFGGKYNGVGFVTKFPTRPIPTKWSSQLGDLPRRHAAHFLVDQTWVSGGVFYGPSLHSERKEVKQHADALLQEVVQVIEPQPGPRFVAGDFNQTTLPIMEWLEDQGWMDAQTVALQRWNVTPMNTCKATSRKDFVMMCPRLQEHIQTVAVHHGIFPDHSIIHVTLSNLGSPQPIPRWFKPGAIQLTAKQVGDYRAQWTSPLDSDQLEDTCQTTTVSQPTEHDPSHESSPHRHGPSEEDRVTQQYAQLWHQWEFGIDQFLKTRAEGGLTSQQKAEG